MRRIKGKDTAPELAVRRQVFAMGFRYRLHGSALPGKPDLVFPKMRKAIFVHGCFWHRHGNTKCKIARLPKSNCEYWADKLEKNVSRDAARRAQLRRMGWKTIVIWECEARSINNHLRRIKKFLNA